ncbi:MAG: hypothetical protein JXR61_01850, partial [Prolixibacteraceae bacterium]|nr:hypothetical protein [Prolixibacteraceae bacterium]
MKKFYQTLKTSRTALTMLLMGILLLVANAGFAQTVTLSTDKLDYAPGEIVYITGTGWLPGETVNLWVINETYPALNITIHYLDWDVTADSNGSFSSWWNVTEDELNTSLVLTALGDSSGYREQVFFTDGQRDLSSLAIGTQNTTIVYGSSGNPTFSVQVNTTASGGGTANLNNISLSITGLPSGVTFDSFNPPTLNASNGTPNPTSILTLNVSNSMNAGSYDFTVTASITQGNNTTSVSGTGNLVIDKALTTTVVTINGGPFTYTGSAITPATVSVTGAGGLNETPAANYADNVNAGTATASYSYAGDDNYLPSSDSKTFTISKADAVISVTPYNVTYDGEAHTSVFTAV